MATEKKATKVATKKAAVKAATKPTVKTANGNKAPQAKNDDKRKSTPKEILPKEQVLKPGRTGKSLEKKIKAAKVNDLVELEKGDVVPVVEGSKDALFEAEWLKELSEKGAIVDDSEKPAGKKLTKIITTHAESPNPPKAKGKKGRKKSAESENMMMPVIPYKGQKVSDEDLFKMKCIINCLITRPYILGWLVDHLEEHTS